MFMLIHLTIVVVSASRRKSQLYDVQASGGNKARREFYHAITDPVYSTSELVTALTLRPSHNSNHICDALWHDVSLVER